MGMMKEFKDFAMKGNVIDLALGVIIGGAFGKIVDSAVKDLIMPIIGKIIGNTDFSNMFIQLGNLPADYKGAMNYADLSKAGVNIFAYGNFLTILINFLILAFVVFQMVRAYGKMKAAEPAPAPAAIPEDVVLLREIRDSLKK
jgi:large conductance mechanosensitive channel